MDTSTKSAIVVVEDDPTMEWILGKAIEQIAPEYLVYTCANGVEGLAYLVDHHVCCVVTDYKMPVMDGLTFTEVLRNQWPTISVIMITGDAHTLVQTQAQQEQSADLVTILVKPVSVDQLRAAIAPILATCDPYTDNT